MSEDAPSGSTPVEPSAPDSSLAKPKKPIWKRWWFIAAAAVIVIGAIANSGSSTETTATSDPASQAPASQAPASQAPASQAPASQAPAPKAACDIPSKEVRDGKFAFKVKSVKSGVDEVGGQYLNQKAQGQYVIVRLKVTNIGDESQTFFGDNQKLYDTKGREFDADGTANAYANEDATGLLSDINPGNSLSVNVVFDLPKSAKAQKVKLFDSAFSGGVEVCLR